MKKTEIKALEYRFKSTMLMLLSLEMLNGEIDELCDISHMAFDCSKYDTCKEALDLIDFKIVNILEID